MSSEQGKEGVPAAPEGKDGLQGQRELLGDRETPHPSLSACPLGVKVCRAYHPLLYTVRVTRVLGCLWAA